jgi:hypothetical protein
VGGAPRGPPGQVASSSRSSRRVPEMGAVNSRVGGLDQSIRIEMFGDLHEYGALGRVVTKAEALKAL